MVTPKFLVLAEEQQLVERSRVVPETWARAIAEKKWM